MAEHRNSSASEGISDYAEGTELINKAPLIMAMFSPNLVSQQSQGFEQYSSDMTDKAMDEASYEDQFGSNTYEGFREFPPDMTDEKMDQARHEEQFGNRFENIATPTFSQLSHPTTPDDFEDSLPKVDVPNRNKDDCGCSICLEYYRDKDDCGCSTCQEYYPDKDDCNCSICLEYYRHKDDCTCSICLEYDRYKDDCTCAICLEIFRGTDKAKSPTDAS